jgi:uncharacterized protein YbjQ (UPF0145 family)
MDLILFLVLVAIGFFVGRIAERRHYASIRRREAELASIMVFATRFPPTLEPRAQHLVSGSVVVSDDYFKRAVARLQAIVGGRLKTYETLVDRARREAILRMKAEAKQRGGAMVVNVKFQTFAVPGKKAGSMRAVEVLAWGTSIAA